MIGAATDAERWGEVRNPTFGLPGRVDAVAHDDIAVPRGCRGLAKSPAAKVQPIIICEHVQQPAHPARRRPDEHTITGHNLRIADNDGAVG